MNALALLFAAAVAPTAGPDLSAGPNLSAEAVAAAVQPYLDRYPHAAVVVGVAGPGGRSVYGFGELPGGKTPDGRTLYEICSLTKAFTGTLLARLAAAGVVSEDDPAADRLPADLRPRPFEPPGSGAPGFGAPGAVGPVTLAQLATHTAGLPFQPASLGAVATGSAEPRDPYAAFDRRWLARDLAATPAAPPGTFSYSNLGIGLLGHALANAAAGDPLAAPAVMRERLLRPLGLNDTTFAPSAEQAVRFAPPHRPDGTPTPAWTFASLESAGGLRSTADDLLAFADACLGRSDRPAEDIGFDPAALFREAARPRALALYDAVGLGWFTRYTPHGPMVWHDGRTAGSAAYLGILTNRGVAVVVLSNAGADVDDVIVRLFSGETE